MNPFDTPLSLGHVVTPKNLLIHLHKTHILLFLSFSVLNTYVRIAEFNVSRIFVKIMKRFCENVRMRNKSKKIVNV